MTHVVAELILLLVAQDGERRDGRRELVVAERFEAGNRLEGGAERKGEGESEILITGLGMMQVAGVKGKRSKPSRAECELVPQHQVEIVRSGGRAG